LIERSYAPEIMDDPDLPDDLMDRVHSELTRVHHWLGNTSAILSALRRDPLPVRRVLDIGCGNGGLLLEIRRKLRVEVVGVELRAPSPNLTTIPIVQADAVRSPLPACDVAFAVFVAHHLSDPDFMELDSRHSKACKVLQ
jgi:SAM-dependent methyltransferase